MKLCAIVFAFHQSPAAMSGIDGPTKERCAVREGQCDEEPVPFGQFRARKQTQCRKHRRHYLVPFGRGSAFSSTIGA